MQWLCLLKGERHLFLHNRLLMSDLMQRGCSRNGVSRLYHFSSGLYPGDEQMEKKGEWSDVGANEILSEYEAFGRQQILSFRLEFYSLFSISLLET